MRIIISTLLISLLFSGCILKIGGKDHRQFKSKSKGSSKSSSMGLRK